MQGFCLKMNFYPSAGIDGFVIGALRIMQENENVFLKNLIKNMPYSEKMIDFLPVRVYTVCVVE